MISKTAESPALPSRARVNPNLLKYSRAVHIYLSIALLLVLVFFAITGITLNHAGSMTAAPETSSQTFESLPELPLDESGRISISPELGRYLKNEFGVRLSLADVRYEDEFLIVDYQVPGTATLIEIDMDLGQAYFEVTDYGLVAALNDLHKGRHTDLLWSILIDLSGVLTVIFALAGFVLLLPSKRRFRRVAKYSTAGIAALVALYFIVWTI